MQIVLASSSPRRQELLHLLISDFIIDPARCDEAVADGLSPEDMVGLLATRKASDAYARHEGCTVIGADTVVEIDGAILGKPADCAAAFSMLKMLSGRTHRVHTGLAVITPERKTQCCVSADVLFGEMTDGEIQWYIRTGEPFDKAGAYGIQGFGARFIKGIQGDFYTVMGLPVRQLYNMFTLLGIECV